MSESYIQAVLLLHKRLQIGCFCVDDEQTSVSVLEVAIQRFLNLTEFHINDHDSDFVLMCCSLIERLCHLFTTCHASDYICSSLVDLINFVQHSCQVTNHLIPFMLCKRRFVAFAATKALIGLLKVECISSGNSLCASQFCKKWTAGLLSLDETMISRVSCMEQLVLDFKIFYKGNTAICPNRNCTSVKVNRPDTELFNEILMCNILQSAISIPALVKAILSSPCNAARMHALHCILRLLTIAFEKPTAIKDAFLLDASSLIALLTTEMPSLVWEKTCSLLRGILDYQTTTVSEQDTSTENKFVLASQFLQLVKAKLWTVLPCNDGFHGFGGPFRMDDVNPISIECYAGADKPLFQSYLLCNLACLANVSARFQAENEENVQLFHGSVAAIQECIQEKICSSQNVRRVSYDDIQGFCVPALRLFGDQDDALVQMLLYFLDISKCIRKQDLLEKRTNPFYSYLWNPHIQFYIFLLIVNNDYEVLLDLLISEETCFLLYFLKYLKLIVSDWYFFAESHTIGQLCELTLHDSDTKEQIHLTYSDLLSKLSIHDKETEGDEFNKLVDYELSSEDSDMEEEIVTTYTPVSVKQHSNDANGKLCKLSLHDRDAKKPIDFTYSEPSSKLNIHDNETEKCKINQLVDYEISSEDSDLEENFVTTNLPVSDKQPSNDAKADSYVASVHTMSEPKNTLLEVLLVFNCLLNTIEKQTDKNLFPYNAKPLVRLLKLIQNNF